MKFKKVGFYLFNRNISSVNLSNVSEGNPGIGGSEYMAVLIASQLANKNNKINITLFVEVAGLFPSGVDIKIVSNIESALSIASKEEYDLFVIDQKLLNWNNNPFKNVYGNLKIICWCHNFITTSVMRKLSKSKRVKCVLFVGREQMDIYRDDAVFRKSEYIYNAVPIKKDFIANAKLVPFQTRPHTVAFLGSLVKNKNFHVLASLWPRILARVPDAELYVIGSGRVYSRNSQLGKYNIAEKDYEDLFMQFLTDDYGRILPSVHFLGNMDNQKFDILKNIRVGCPNPTGDSETFCLSAVEMQAMGCVVAAMEAPGYYDTFFNGHISKDINSLYEDIITNLNCDSNEKYEDTISFIDKNFSLEIIINDWEKLLLSEECKIHPILPLVNSRYKHKWLKELLRKVYSRYPFLYNFCPSLVALRNIFN